MWTIIVVVALISIAIRPRNKPTYVNKKKLVQNRIDEAHRIMHERRLTENG